ncbi:unnamed protein product [Brassica rapa subsp. trilocularis]
MITQQMIEQGVLDCLLEEGETDDALMGILRVIHKITESDHFVIAANDGLFNFFSNKEVIELVHAFISSNPCGELMIHQIFYLNVL